MLNNFKLPNFIAIFNKHTGSAKSPDNTVDQAPLQYDKKVRVSVTLAVIGILLFMAVSIIFPFKNQIFEKLFPKPGSQAALCTGKATLSDEKNGFVYTAGDLDQAIKSLKTSLYYTHDMVLDSKKGVYMIGRYAGNTADPVGLTLLMDNNLSNTGFKGLWGQTPAGWNLLTSGQSGTATVETADENILDGGTSLKIANHKSTSGTQVSQTFKKDIAAGQFIVFGSWVKTANPEAVKIFIQNTQEPFEELGNFNTTIEPNEWSYVLGYGKVPEGVKNFQVVLRVTGEEKTAWFSNVTAAITGSNDNQTISKLVLERCGAAWLVDDSPGWDQTYSSPHMKPLSGELYALIFHQFYTAIKNTDPSAKVLSAGLMGSPVVFDKPGTYSPKTFLDAWRNAYRNFFNTEPSADAIGIQYFADDKNSWSDATDLERYLGKLRSYLDQIPGWKGKPIWITKIGVGSGASNGGADFAKSAIRFLSSNNLNVEKWFWFDTCGYKSQLVPLFESNNKICSWPMKPTALGSVFASFNITPTPTALPIPTLTPMPSITTAVTPPATAGPEATATATPTVLPTNTLTPTPTTEASPSATVTP